MSKGKLLKNAFKAVGGTLANLGGKALNALKSLTKSKPKKEDTKVDGVPTKVKSEVKTSVDNKPEVDKLAEQDNREAEAESKASKIADSKNDRDKSLMNSISNRTRSILQNYGLKGDLVKSVKSTSKSAESQAKNQSTVYNKSDIYNIYQQKDHSVSIDKAIMMLAANNDILANVNETLKLIHNQGSIEIDYRKIKSDTAKVLSEKAKDESSSTNNAASKVNQKLSEIKMQQEIFKQALLEAKDPDQVAYAKKMTELLAKIELNQQLNTDERGGGGNDSGLLEGLLTVIPSLLSFIPGLGKGALNLAKGLWNGAKSGADKMWNSVKSLFSGSSSSVAKSIDTAANVTKSTVAKTGSKSVAKAGVKEFFKKLSPRALKVITKKLIAKAILKKVAITGGKAALKKIPIAGAAVGLGLGISRCMGDKPDYAGAAIDVASGIASIFPGAGTAISAGLDLAGITRDVYNCIDELKNGNIPEGTFDDEDLSEILVEPTEDEMAIFEAQDKESSSQAYMDSSLLAIPAFGPMLAAGRYGYRKLRENGIIEGNSTLDKLSGHDSVTNAGIEASMKSSSGTKAAAAGASGFDLGKVTKASPVNSGSNIPSHVESKISDKKFKGVTSVGKSSTDDLEELSDTAEDFKLNSENKAVMEYWKDHPASPTDQDAANKLVDYWKSYEGKLDYSQSVRDINKGSTDCSGMVMNSMKNLFGIDVTDGGKGYCAASFATNKVGAVVTQSDIDPSGNGTGKITDEMKEQLQPGDVIYTRLDKWKGNRPYAIGHASLYVGDGMCLSQGGLKKGPYKVPLSAYDGKFVLAKRYLGTGNAEITKAEVESAKNPNSPIAAPSSSNSKSGVITSIQASSGESVTKSSDPTPIKSSPVNSPSFDLLEPNGLSKLINNSDSHNLNDNSQTTNVYNNTYNNYYNQDQVPDQSKLK